MVWTLPRSRLWLQNMTPSVLQDYRIYWGCWSGPAWTWPGPSPPPRPWTWNRTPQNHIDDTHTLRKCPLNDVQETDWTQHIQILHQTSTSASWETFPTPESLTRAEARSHNSPLRRPGPSLRSDLHWRLKNVRNNATSDLVSWPEFSAENKIKYSRKKYNQIHFKSINN